MQRPERKRVVIHTSSRGPHRGRGTRTPLRSREGVVALSVIAAAALATFLALFLTSRPYDPMNSTFNAQATAPVGGMVMQTSPTPSPSATAVSGQSPPATNTEPAGATASATPDDATIQAQIEKRLRADTVLAELDVSTIVEGGHVTVVGSVRSNELKQRIERVIRSVEGVTGIDNQLVVIEGTPPGQ